MGGFKRFVFVVYGLAGTVAFAALGLSWYGPWVRQVASLMGTDWFYRAVAGLSVAGAFGTLLILLIGLFSSRSDVIRVNLPDGGHVTVTRDAVSSRAATIVEADGTCVADDVVVRAKRRRGGVRVFVRVCPMSSIDVMHRADELREELRYGLASLVGDRLRSVDLEFTEPQVEDYRMSFEEPAAEPLAPEPAAWADAPAPLAAPVAEPEAPSAAREPDEGRAEDAVGETGGERDGDEE